MFDTHKVILFFLITLSSIGIKAQENRIPLQEIIEEIKIPPKEKTRLSADFIQEGFIYPSPSQMIHTLKINQTTILWDKVKSKYVAKYTYQDKDMNDSLMEWVTQNYNEIKDESNKIVGFDIPFPDGEYQCMENPLPYLGFWVNNETRRFSVQQNTTSSIKKKEKIKDLYFDKAWRSFFYRATTITIDKQIDLASILRQQTILISSDFETYLTQQGIDTMLNSVFNVCAYIDNRGYITFYLIDKEDKKNSRTVLSHLNSWASTLPPFAFNGFYTLDGRFLPARFFRIYISNGRANLMDWIEDSIQFQERLKI